MSSGSLDPVQPPGNTGDMAKVCTTAAANHLEVRQTCGKISMQVTKFLRIALIEFFSPIELFVTHSGGICP